MKKLLSMFVALGLISFVGCGEEAPKKAPTKPAAKAEGGKKEEMKKEEKKEEMKKEEKKEEMKKEEKKEEKKADAPKVEEKK